MRRLDRTRSRAGRTGRGRRREKVTKVAVEPVGVGAMREMTGTDDLHQSRARNPFGDDPAAGVVPLVVSTDDHQRRDLHLLQPLEHHTVGLGADALDRCRHAVALGGDEVVPRLSRPWAGQVRGPRRVPVRW